MISLPRKRKRSKNYARSIEDAVKSGQQSPQGAQSTDDSALSTLKANVDQQFDIATQGMDQTTTAYQAELQKRNDFDLWYADQVRSINDQTNKSILEGWQQTDDLILGTENQLVDDIFTKRQSLSTDLLQIAYKEAEQQTALLLKNLTEHELANSRNAVIRQSRRRMMASPTSCFLLSERICSASHITRSQKPAPLPGRAKRQRLAIKAAGAGGTGAKRSTIRRSSSRFRSDASSAAAGAAYGLCVGIPYRASARFPRRLQQGVAAFCSRSKRSAVSPKGTSDRAA